MRKERENGGHFHYIYIKHDKFVDMLGKCFVYKELDKFFLLLILRYMFVLYAYEDTMKKLKKRRLYQHDLFIVFIAVTCIYILPVK